MNAGNRRYASVSSVGKGVACVAWRFWLGALTNKGGRGQRNREEIGAGATYFLAGSPLVRPARQNRHARQANNSLRSCPLPIIPLSLSRASLEPKKQKKQQKTPDLRLG